MSEKFSSKQDKQAAVDTAIDFIGVDSLGRARVPAGSGTDWNGNKIKANKSGKFMSDNELALIADNASLIYDGMQNRENEALLEAIGQITDPQEIYEIMLDQGFVDEDYFIGEENESRNEEILRMLAETRAEVANFYGIPTQSENMKRLEERLGKIGEPTDVKGKRRANVEVDAPSQAQGYIRKQDRELGRHRAESSDESNPIFDELLAKFNQPALVQQAREGESLEEYEARHMGGRHAEPLPVATLDAIAAGENVAAPVIEPLPIAGLEAIANGLTSIAEPLPTDTLDAIARGEEVADNENEAIQSRSRRLRDRLSPGALAARASAWNYSRRSRSRERDADGTERGNNKKAIIGLGVLGAAITGVGIYYVTHKYGGGSHPSSGGFGDFLNDIADKAQDGLDSISNIDVDADKKSGSDITAKAHELFGNGNVEVRSGDGYTQSLGRVLNAHDVHLSSKELYNLHQHLEHTQGEYINLHGAHDTYTMANGDSGLSRPDGSAHVSEVTQKAVVRWLQARGKI